MIRSPLRILLALTCAIIAVGGFGLIAAQAKKPTTAKKSHPAKKHPAKKHRAKKHRAKKHRAKKLPSTALGVNVKLGYDNDQPAPADLSLASGSGAGLARISAPEGTDMDSTVRFLAESHMRLYPMLGLPCPAGTAACGPQTLIPPATAATEMAQYVTTFARQYGPNGMFWKDNPSLPYLPVKSFEIGNEPNIRFIFVEDELHLHWPDPSNSLLPSYPDYAKVYEASRTALHKVDPSGKAVVGGLADSAGGGVDVESAENLLHAMPRGGVDAVGYHGWVFASSNSLLEPDLADLRVWMNHHGLSRAALDVNEFGACGTQTSAQDNQACPVLETSAKWGAAAAAYTKWALCTSWTHVESVQAFPWGALSTSDADIWLQLVATDGIVTRYGRDFLNAARTLTSTGCPRLATRSLKAPAHSKRPTVSGTPASGKMLRGKPGIWKGKPKPKLYYQWLQCNPLYGTCISIHRANSARYRLQPTDVGSTVVLLVSALSRAGAATATSARTGPILAIAPARKPKPKPKPKKHHRG